MRLAFYSIFVALLMVGTAGCGDDDPTGPGNGNGQPTNGTMTATVDGKAWSAIQISAVNNNGIVAISGSDAALVAVGFGFQGAVPGTYTIGPTSVANASVIENFSNHWRASGAEGSGSITLTTLTATEAAGTFSYSAPLFNGTGTPDPRVVTNGVFNITF